jgi:hypothetical protein
VYRPDHFAFRGLDAHYGDVIGADVPIFGFEVDGLAYTFECGRPYPTGADGAPADRIEILAMGLVDNCAFPHDHALLAVCLHGDDGDAALAKTRYGSGMVVDYRRGAGHVVHAGTCEWVLGLGIDRADFATAAVTRNILVELAGPPSRALESSAPARL